VSYRVGACGAEQDVPRLRALRTAYPEFVDADYALARQALGNREAPDQDDALMRLRAAAAAFPHSPAILSSLGLLHEEREEWAEALAAHDAALVLVPTHRDALLGRAIALSNLLRRDDAIAAADRLIELGNWFLAQAHYWRAWNLFHLERYAEARVDADAAKAGAADPAVLVLSGMIEWRVRRFDGAEREFEGAIRLDAQQCEAGTFLAAVLAEQGRPRDSLNGFIRARTCFERFLAARREELAKLDAGPASPEAKARQRARDARAIADATARHDEAARNERALRQRLGLGLGDGAAPERPEAGGSR
jgi:tetratricopeptide (TPR) repeat protein